MPKTQALTQRSRDAGAAPAPVSAPGLGGAAAAEVEPISAAQASWRVLIVDDDPLALFMTASIASMALPGIHVESVEDPGRAVELCARISFDCILVDYDMPGLNGIEFARQVREGDVHVPILMCTAAGNEMVVADAMKMGINDYLPKTCMTATALGAAIGEAIEGARQSRRLEAQHRDLETFAFALAHEIRQPARQVSTLAAMARREEGVSEGSRLDQLLGHADAAAARLNALVDVLTDYAVLSAPPQLETVSVDAIARKVAEEARASAAGREPEIVVAGEAEVLGHPLLLEMALANLVGNGLKYNESAVPRICINCRAMGAFVEIRVSDNGIGIAPEHVESVFRPLFRLHPRGRYQGTGLGLGIVRKAAAAMNGTVRCISRVSGGTTFVMTLQPGPCMPEALAERRSRAPKIQQQEGQ